MGLIETSSMVDDAPFLRLTYVAINDEIILRGKHGRVSWQVLVSRFVRYSPIKVIKERQQVNSQLDPAFLHRFGEGVGVHDVGWVVETGPGHALWTVLVPPNVIRD